MSGEMMSDWLATMRSRATCALLGHRWVKGRIGMDYCVRLACRGWTFRPTR